MHETGKHIAEGKSDTRHGNAFTRALPYVVLILAMIAFSLPLIADIVNSSDDDKAIQAISSLYDDDNDPELMEVRAEAQAYNDALGGVQNDRVPKLPYADQMRYKNTDKLGWLEIDGINLRLPIYRGTSDTSLSAGIGHLEQSSLPCGGKSSHCVLSGHSGMLSKRMFDDIRSLSVGDVFEIHELGEVHAYEIYDIETVLPEEIDKLRIEPGRDIVTLMTCTPYGINTHRLLVHAERTDYVAEPFDPIKAFFSHLNMRTIPFLVGIGICLAIMVVIAVLRYQRRKLLTKIQEQGSRGEDEQRSSTRVEDHRKKPVVLTVEPRGHSNPK